MPISGGAIQPAILPGSVTRRIRLATKARSSEDGSQSGSRRRHSSSAIGWPSGVGRDTGPDADRAAEAGARQPEAKLVAGLGDEPVPALHANTAIADIGGTRHLVHGLAQRHVLARNPALAVRHLDPQALVGS